MSAMDAVPFASGAIITGTIAMLMKYVGGKAALAVYGIPMGLIISLLFVAYGSGIGRREAEARVKTSVANLIPALMRIVISTLVLYAVYRVTNNLILSVTMCLLVFLLLVVLHYLFVCPSPYACWEAVW